MLSVRRISAWPGVVFEALGDAALDGFHRYEVHAVELVAHIAPGVAGPVLDDTDQQQTEPARLDVAPDPVLAVMEDRPEPK